MARLPSCFERKMRPWSTHGPFVKEILSVSQLKADLAFLIYSMPNISLQPMMLDP